MNQSASLNTHSYLLNFFSFLNEQNPYYYDQMNWMMKELTQAEQAGEKVMFFSCEHAHNKNSAFRYWLYEMLNSAWNYSVNVTIRQTLIARVRYTVEFKTTVHTNYFCIHFVFCVGLSLLTEWLGVGDSTYPSW